MIDSRPELMYTPLRLIEITWTVIPGASHEFLPSLSSPIPRTTGLRADYGSIRDYL